MFSAIGAFMGSRKFLIPAAVVAFVLGGWWFVSNLSSENQSLQSELTKTQTQQEQTLKEAKALTEAVEGWSDTMTRLEKTLDLMAQNQLAALRAREHIARLYNEYDIPQIARDNPDTTERELNRVSSDLNRMLEQASRGLELDGLRTLSPLDPGAAAAETDPNAEGELGSSDAREGSRSR